MAAGADRGNIGGGEIDGPGIGRDAGIAALSRAAVLAESAQSVRIEGRWSGDVDLACEACHARETAGAGPAGAATARRDVPAAAFGPPHPIAVYGDRAAGDGDRQSAERGQSVSFRVA